MKLKQACRRKKGEVEVKPQITANVKEEIQREIEVYFRNCASKKA